MIHNSEGDTDVFTHDKVLTKARLACLYHVGRAFFVAMIYALVNAKTGEARYVGRTGLTVPKRLADHKSKARTGRQNTPSAQWIRQIGPENVDTITLEENPEDEDRAELWWMSYLEFVGCNLLNVRRQPTFGKVGEMGGIEVTDEMLKMMGEVLDREVAEKFDVCVETVKKYRYRLGIERSVFVELPDECLEQLGDKPDAELADEFGVSKSTIARRRKFRSINPYRKWKVDVPQKCLNQLGKKTDGALAKEYGLTREIVKKRRTDRNIDPAVNLSKVELTPEQESKLGKVSDRELAEEVGVSARKIGELRNKRGIRPFKKSQWLSDEEAGEVKWLAHHSDLTQKEIGDRYGISDANVCNIKHGNRRAEVEPKRPQSYD